MKFEFFMLRHQITFPVAYFRGTAYFFAPAETYSSTYFGGPSDVELIGKPSDSAPLHHVLTISSALVPALGEFNFLSLPLFYGLRYSGCSLVYRMPNGSDCEITNLEPNSSSEDFPYKHYPVLLPYVPLRVERSVPFTPEMFSGLANQEVEIRQMTMTVIVPPIYIGGVSLWGPAGDAEGVQIIFECDFRTKMIRASNQCT